MNKRNKKQKHSLKRIVKNLSIKPSTIIVRKVLISAPDSVIRLFKTRHLTRNKEASSKTQVQNYCLEISQKVLKFLRYSIYQSTTRNSISFIIAVHYKLWHNF